MWRNTDLNNSEYGHFLRSECLQLKFITVLSCIFKHITQHLSDVWQCLFCFLIGCIQQFYWLTIVLNNFFRFEVELFSTPKKKKKSSTRKRNYCVLSGCACAKLRKNFSSGPWGLYGYKNLYPRLLHKEYFVCCEE